MEEVQLFLALSVAFQTPGDLYKGTQELWLQ